MKDRERERVTGLCQGKFTKGRERESNKITSRKTQEGQREQQGYVKENSRKLSSKIFTLIKTPNNIIFNKVEMKNYL